MVQSSKEQVGKCNFFERVSGQKKWAKLKHLKRERVHIFVAKIWERIIVPLDRPAKIYLVRPLPAALLHLHRLPVQKLCSCRLHLLATPHAMVPVQKRPVQKRDLMFNIVYTGSLVYTGNTGVYDEAPVQMYDYTLPCKNCIVCSVRCRVKSCTLKMA